MCVSSLPEGPAAIDSDRFDISSYRDESDVEERFVGGDDESVAGFVPSKDDSLFLICQ